MKFTIPDYSFEGYIFDCDGTLADTMPLHYIAWKEALAKNGATFNFSEKLFYSLAGMSLEDSINYFNRELNERLEPTSVDKHKVSIFSELIPQIKPIQSVVNYAIDRKENGFPIAVCSGGCRKDVFETLDLLHIKDLFDVIYTQDDVQKGKPNPEMFLKAANFMQVHPEKCLVFEDAQKGIEAAEAANMQWTLIPSQVIN
ncbi:MAG: HAD family hydrolase [Cyclobacteriaceae bacterium]